MSRWVAFSFGIALGLLQRHARRFPRTLPADILQRYVVIDAESGDSSMSTCWSSGLRLAPFLGLIFAACALGVGNPTFTVPLQPNEWGSFEVAVYDASGLVTSATPTEGGPFTNEVVALAERQELEVGWTGGACSHRPTLNISGTAAELRLLVRNPSDPQPLPFFPIECPAVGIPIRVTLTLSQAVAQDAVSLEVSY